MKKLIILIVALGGGLCAQTLQSVPNDFRRELKTGLFDVPTSIATLATVDVLADQISLYNTTAGTLTVSLCDRQSTPKCIIDSRLSLATGQAAILVWPKGELFKGGLTIVASGAGVTGGVSARKQ